jgi:hypothetical protein
MTKLKLNYEVQKYELKKVIKHEMLIHIDFKQRRVLKPRLRNEN